jgi:hypothetical protein
VIRTRGVELVGADQAVKLEGTIGDLGPTPRYRFRAQSDRADVNRLVSTFAGQRDFFYGLLDFRGDVTGTLGGDRPPLEAFEGTMHLSIDRGRLRGVSLLRLTFQGFGAISGIAAIASSVFGGPDLERFYGDEFESISATLVASGGVVRTDDLRIVYRHYTVDLWGNLRFTDLAIDMRGRLTLDEQIDRILAGPQEGSETAAAGSRRVIPLARVTGTLDDPRVELTPEVVSRVVSSFGLGRDGGAIEGVLDKTLGEGAGRILGDTLGEVLGGGRRPTQ